MQLNMKETKKRKVWIDVVKGIAILFIVFYHNPVATQNVLFAIPVFFFISGYLFNPNVTSRALFKRRFNSLLRPYFFTVILISLAYIIFQDGPFFLWYLFWAIYANAPNLPKTALHLWFLPTLFLTTVFVWLVLNNISVLRKSLIGQCLFICGFIICGFFSMRVFSEIRIPLYVTDFFMDDGHHFIINGVLRNPLHPKPQLLSDNHLILKGLPWGLDGVFLSSAFFISGYFAKIHELDKFLQKHIYKHILAIIVIFTVLAFHYFYDYKIDFPERQYNYLLICTFVAFAGNYIMIYAANVIDNWNNSITNALKYIGKYSLVIFIFHPFFESKIYYTGVSILPRAKYIISVLAFIAGVCLPLLLNYFVLERFKFFRYWYYAK